MDGTLTEAPRPPINANTLSTQDHTNISPTKSFKQAIPISPFQLQEANASCIESDRKCIKYYNGLVNKSNEIAIEIHKLQAKKEALERQLQTKEYVAMSVQNSIKALQNHEQKLISECQQTNSLYNQESYLSVTLETILNRNHTVKMQTAEKTKCLREQMALLIEEEKKSEDLRRHAKIHAGGIALERQEIDLTAEKEEQRIMTAIQKKERYALNLERQNLKSEENIKQMSEILESSKLCYHQLTANISNLNKKNKIYQQIRDSYEAQLRALQTKIKETNKSKSGGIIADTSNEYLRKKILTYLNEIGHLKLKVEELSQKLKCAIENSTRSSDTKNNESLLLTEKFQKSQRTADHSSYLFQNNLQFIRTVHQEFDNIIILLKTYCSANMGGFEMPIYSIEKGNGLILAQASLYLMNINKYFNFLTWDIFKSYHYLWKPKFDTTYDSNHPIISVVGSHFSVGEAYKIMCMYNHSAASTKGKLVRKPSLTAQTTEAYKKTNNTLLPDLKLAFVMTSQDSLISTVELTKEAKPHVQIQSTKAEEVHASSRIQRTPSFGNVTPVVNKFRKQQMKSLRFIPECYTETIKDYIEFMHSTGDSEKNSSSKPNKTPQSTADEIIKYKALGNSGNTSYYAYKLSCLKKHPLEVPKSTRTTARNSESLDTDQRINILSTLKSTSKIKGGLVNMVRPPVPTTISSNYKKKLSQMECLNFLSCSQSLRKGMKLFGRIKSL